MSIIERRQPERRFVPILVQNPSRHELNTWIKRRVKRGEIQVIRRGVTAWGAGWAEYVPLRDPRPWWVPAAGYLVIAGASVWGLAVLIWESRWILAALVIIAVSVWACGRAVATSHSAGCPCPLHKICGG